MSTAEYQLQLLAGRDYQPAETGELSAVRAVFEGLTGAARRIVRVDKARPLRPRYCKSRSKSLSTRPDHSKEEVVAAYLAWAKSAGLQQVTAYKGTFFSAVEGIAVRHVDVEDFLGSIDQGETAVEGIAEAA